jgi:uracil-DNA glycosylase
MTDPRRQVRSRLDSLRAAGIEFVPKKLPMPVPEGVAAMPIEPAGPDPLQARTVALQVLAAEVKACARCPELYSTRTQTVFGVGPLSPDICFVGEAPGAEEDRTGEPFVGAAGQLLNKIIAACGLQRSDVYICNTIKCRPPNNRVPAPDEKANCRGYFDAQLDLLAPRYIVCLGGVAAQSVLNTATGITKLRGKFHEFRGLPVLCTFHPAYLLRNPAAKKDAWEDFKFLLNAMGRPIPATGGAAAGTS